MAADCRIVGYRKDGRPIFPIRGGAPRRSELKAARLTEIKAELQALDELEDQTDDDLSRSGTLADEFETGKAEFDRLVELERRMDAIRSTSVDYAAPGTRPDSVGGHQGIDPGDDRGRRGYMGVSHKRDPYDALVAVRSMTLAPGEMMSRGCDAVEQAPGWVSDASKEHATALIQRSGKRQGAMIARHMLVTGSPEYYSAFEEYMQDPTNLQRASLSLTSANGGYLVPFTLDPSVILTNSGSINPYRQIATVKTTATNTWNGVASAGMNAAWLAEGIEVGDNSPTFSNIVITPQKASAWVFGSYEILEDSDFATEVPMLLGDAKDRLEENAFAVGTGSGQPKGIFVAATTTVTSGAAGPNGTPAAGATGTSGLWSVNDLYNTQAALPPRFRTNAAWVTSLNAINIARGFDTAGGSSYWTNLGQGSPERVLGGNIYESTSTPTYALTAATKLAVYGDFSQYAIVDRIGMSVMYEPMVKGATFRPTGSGGWFAFWRVGADALIPGAFRTLVAK
jgi:HK97 family phage major capsid protein